jgi:hypothetical protein
MTAFSFSLFTVFPPVTVKSPPDHFISGETIAGVIRLKRELRKTDCLKQGRRAVVKHRNISYVYERIESMTIHGSVRNVM